MPGPVPEWVDPEYEQLNPRYNRPKEKPLWGLAKPLPRVVRPGMRPKTAKEARRGRKAKPSGTTAEGKGDGEGATAPAPQVAKVPGQQMEEEEGVGPRGRGKGDGRSGGGKGAESRRGSRGSGTGTRAGVVVSGGKTVPMKNRLPTNLVQVNSNGSTKSLSGWDCFGTPGDERDNPMDLWEAAPTKTGEQLEAAENVDAARKMYSNASDAEDVDGDGDMGSRPLSVLAEVPTPAEGSSAWEGYGGVDLEAGYGPDDVVYEGDFDDYGEDEYGQDEYGGGEGTDDQKVGYEEDSHHDEYNHWCAIRTRFREPLAECLAVCYFPLLRRPCLGLI